MGRSFAIFLDAYAGKALLFFLTIIFCIKGYTQTIEYSRQNFKTPYPDAMQLVADVSGNSHLLCFTSDENIILYVYDINLHLQGKKEVQIKMHEYDDINLIPFKGFYFLYIHRRGSSKHGLWKIDREGNASSVSDSFQHLIEAVFKKNTATLQLVNKNNRLFIIANTYYDEFEKIGSTVIQADENLNVVRSRSIFYEFKKHEDNLKQVMLAGDDLLILKTSKDSTGHLLKIIKANLNTGDLLMNSFSSGSYMFSNPAFSYNAADSGIVIHSMIDGTFFITKLDYLLNEKVPVTLLKNQFRNNIASDFLLLEGQTQKWIDTRFTALQYRNYDIRSASALENRRIAGYPMSDMYGRPLVDYFQNNSILSVNSAGMLYMKSLPYNSNYGRSNPISTGVRFTVLNNSFRVLKDSVVTNQKSSFTLEPVPSVHVVLKNKSYLFLSNRFGVRRHGLVMMSGNNKGDLLATDIHVYDKYEYLLPQLQAVNDKYVIVPYLYKRELGLVKITLE